MSLDEPMDLDKPVTRQEFYSTMIHVAGIVLAAQIPSVSDTGDVALLTILALVLLSVGWAVGFDGYNRKFWNLVPGFEVTG